MIKKNILCFAAPLLLALSFFVSGCASSPSKKETAVLSSIDSHATKPHAAFISNGSFYIQFVFEGKDVYFKAEDSTQNADAMAKYNIALLKAVNPSKDVLENKGPNAVFISKGFESIIKTVLEDFLPKKNGEGKIVNVQDYEMFLYRDKDGNPALTSLEKAPKDIKIVGSVPDADFDALLLKTIQKDLAVKDKGATQFLFPLIGRPLQPYLFVDVKNNYSTTLQLPEYYELKKQMSELGFSMSFIYSFFIKSHFFAIIKAPFTSVHRLLSLTTNSLMAISTPKPDIEGPIPPINTSGETMDMADFNTYLDTLSKRVYKADVGLLIDGEEFFSHFILNANKATHSIFIRLYIFGADPYAVRLADVLKEKSNEGVQVRLILDDLNTLLNFKKEPDLTYPKDFVMPNIKSYLKEDSKVKVRTRPNTWGTFDHSKVIIIDRDLAYTGGMNFAEEYRYTWHDMMVSLRGPVVGRLVKDFYESWSFVGWGGDYASLYRQIFSKRQREQNIEKPGMVDVRLLYTTPGTAQIFHAHLEAIKRAKKRIYIENAYFGDDRILEGILEARARGVDVRVIFPSKNDVSVMHKNNIIMANKLFKNGVKVYFYRGMTHVKAALYDDWALVGSANFDKMSLFVNKEMSLGISDEKFVNELETRLFEKDFANSDLMEEEFDLGLGYHIVQALAAQF